MRRLIRIAARWYPVWWRRRYGNEFDALLDDVTPGWRDVVDVFAGAITMQIKTLGMPVALALVGAAIGAVVATRLPPLYASTATIQFTSADPAGNAGTLERLRHSLDTALDGEAKAATLVALLKDDSAHATVRLTYLNRDPVQAQHVAAKLAAVVTKGSDGRAGAAEVLDAPDVPTSPTGAGYPASIAWGTALGLLGGGLLVVFRTRRSPRAH
jgi:hypothetical protein